MPDEQPFIRIELKPSGEMQMLTNIQDASTINLYLDYAKAKLIQSLINPPEQPRVVPVGAAQMPRGPQGVN